MKFASAIAALGAFSVFLSGAGAIDLDPSTPGMRSVF